MDLVITDLRRNYIRDGLRESDVDADPIMQFKAWLQQALNASLHEPNAMAVTTVNAGGQPSTRMLLLKGIDQNGFVFYTNYNSRKATDILVNPQVALLFWWDVLERQVRIEGRVEKLPAKESDEYFAMRPRGSQLGAWSSDQSSVIAGREELERKLRHYTDTFGDGVIERPGHWGGYVLHPATIEFWQGRPNRLHDRLRYTRQDGKQWLIERLSP